MNPESGGASPPFFFLFRNTMCTTLETEGHPGGGGVYRSVTLRLKKASAPSTESAYKYICI